MSDFTNKHVSEMYCPLCDTFGDIETDAPAAEGEVFWVECRCPRCGGTWRDYYKPERDFPGETCPECGAGGAELSEPPEADGDIAWQEAECAECHHVWRNGYVYEFSAV